jgi:hypothetical protein
VVASRAGTIRCDGAAIPIRAVRTITIGGGRLDPWLELGLTIEHAGPAGGPAIDALVAVEWSTMLLGGGHNPSAWLEVGRDRTAHDATRIEPGVDRLAAGNDFLGIAVATTTDGPVDAWIAPIETVSNSEAGFELVYQGSAALLVEPLRLGPGELWQRTIRHEATCAGDRAIGEGAGEGAAWVPAGEVEARGR